MSSNAAGCLPVFIAVLATSTVLAMGPHQLPSDTAEFRVLVTGSVRYPGRATLKASEMTVPDALAAVGSPTADAGDEVIVIRAAHGAAGPLHRTINLKEMETGKPGLDLTLEDGDIINVPEGNRFFVSGAVRRPGAYRLRTGTTVAQALMMIGGVAEGGNERRIRIRRVVKGKSVEISPKPGDLVLPNDEIKVPRKMF
jgi:protein involved in polysaccharide export with SLBB domain